LWKQIHELITNIWEKEKIPDDMTIGIVYPIHKKEDKTVSDNYRGITVLSQMYKIMSCLIYNRINQYAEKYIGEYQSGFRNNRSTIDKIHIMRLTYKKCTKFNIDLHNLFIDFKQAFDKINRSKML
jgi:hypothetical protein